MIRELIFYEHYFFDFYDAQPKKVQEKIDYVLDLIANVERVPEKFLKHLEDTDGLYEIRVKVGSDIFRFFCFFDAGKLVVVLQGFQKKSPKTPMNELVKAERLKCQYFEEKNQ
jgi:phage-related protein